MEKLVVLNEIDALSIEGGSELSKKICYILGAMFLTPGLMDANGSAAYDIMGSK